MDELHFKILKTLNETHNITKTADRLFMSQSSISRQISALEEELGTPLITRTRLGVSFTPAGETVFAGACAAAAALEQMHIKLLQQKGVVAGSVTIGITNLLVSQLLSNIAEQCQKRYPYVNIKIVTDHSRKLVKRLAEGELDVAFVRGDQDWYDGKLTLKTEQLYIIRSERNKNLPLAEIPYIDRQVASQFARSMNKWLHENDLPRLTSNFSLENIFACLRLVESGLGWAFVPELALKDFHGVSTPAFYRDGKPLRQVSYMLYAHQNLNLPAVKAFVELIQEMYKL